jgi:hypothetical protein
VTAVNQDVLTTVRYVVYTWRANGAAACLPLLLPHSLLLLLPAAA